MPEPKANILVAFYSRDGSVEALAKAISEGAREAGAEVRLRRVPDIVSPAVMAKVPGWEERSNWQIGLGLRTRLTEWGRLPIQMAITDRRQVRHVVLQFLRLNKMPSLGLGRFFRPEMSWRDRWY